MFNPSITYYDTAQLAETYNLANSSTNTNKSIFDSCPLILFNHLDPELLKYYHPNYNPKANCTVYEPLTDLNNGRIIVREKAKGFKCKARYAQCILPVKDRTYIAGAWVNLPSNFTFKCDIVETKCLSERTIESFLHMQIYEKTGAVASSRHDVYILIIDSTSSFMAKRSWPKTLKYLKEQVEAVQMEFLNKVGDNSRPNGFPLAFGKSIEGGSRDLVGLPPLVPDWNDTAICHEYLDGYSYHLLDYRKEGYKTMIAQDYDVGMVYYPNCIGFNKSEADHTWRPFDIRRAESVNFKKGLVESCSERHLEMLEYLEKFMHSYHGTPKIAQVWPTTLAHETLKDLFHSDDHFLAFFQKNKKIIDKSFFFFMGDHGPRREGIGELRLGQYENLNPFLMVIIPAVYRNTAIHTQVKKKTHELMTNFDLHATLMDILKLQPASNFTDVTYRDMMPISKGSSLLREWRGPRNCRTLPIPSQYCICQYNKTEVTQDELKLKLGQFLANQLNFHLFTQNLSERCQAQHYNRSSSIMEIRDGGSKLYDAAVYLSPSNGLFSVSRRNLLGYYSVYISI
ncbi:hypothetical protein ANCCAN_09532 [Ancylostoma caninum]|uniref:Uncharacterized protein n=1 Tax=Ancylostoma caninum TaxID=29170 RepID=A0A368GN98_ANCCA|nr:hypothetical protein ANCCAN_09532 [Ancylostoma caninum]